MKHYVEFAVGLLVVLALARWSPEPRSFSRSIRAYLLTLSGVGVVVFALLWVLPRLGLHRFAHLYGVTFVVFGTLLLLSALNVLTFYLEVLRVWPPFSSLSESGRRIACAVLGLVMVALGLDSDRVMESANDRCQEWYAEALTARDSDQVGNRVPDPGLRPEGGPVTGARAPYDCHAIARN